MAKSKDFPITIKAGATAIKIYRSPLRVPVTSKPDGKKQGQKIKFTTYDSFMVVYYQGGKRERRRYNSLEAARTEADRLKVLLLNQDLVALQITGQDLLVYQRAKTKADQLGISLDSLTNEFSEARKMLGETSILEAAQFYDRYGKTVKEKKSVPEVVEELMIGLKADDKSGYHVRDMDHRLETFAQAFPALIMQVSTKEITEWLRNLKGQDSKGNELIFAPKTRNHYRNAVVQLFNFARDHGYLPKGMPTEAESVKPLNVVSPENQIFTVEEMTTLLHNAPAHSIPPFVIKAFSGVRTEEMVSMRWEHVNFDNKHIILPGEVTKTKQRRLIPMPENLTAWLQQYRGHEGRICARWSRPQSLFQALDRVGRRLGLDVGANKFRNSYISYRVAVTHDIQKVSLESGNSPQVIQREYLELATEQEGQRWFEIMPLQQRKVDRKAPQPVRRKKAG